MNDAALFNGSCSRCEDNICHGWASAVFLNATLRYGILQRSHITADYFAVYGVLTPAGCGIFAGQVYGATGMLNWSLFFTGFLRVNVVGFTTMQN